MCISHRIIRFIAEKKQRNEQQRHQTAWNNTAGQETNMKRVSLRRVNVHPRHSQAVQTLPWFDGHKKLTFLFRTPIYGVSWCLVTMWSLTNISYEKCNLIARKRKYRLFPRQYLGYCGCVRNYALPVNPTLSVAHLKSFSKALQPHFH